MDIYKKSWKVFFRTPMMPLAMAAYFLFFFFHLSYLSQYDALYMRPLHTMRDDLLYAVMPYALFMCIGYEMAVKLQETNLDETVAVYPNGRLRIYTGWLSVIVTLALIHFFFPMHKAIWVYRLQGSESAALLRSMLLTGVLYHFLTPCVGGAIGVMLAVWFKRRRLPVYAIVLMMTLLTTDYVDAVMFIPYNMTRGSDVGVQITDILYRIKDFCTFTPYGLNPSAFPDYLYGIPMEPERWLLVLCWLSAAGFVLIWTTTGHSRGRRVALAACALLFVLSGGDWVIRDSVVQEGFRPSSVLTYDQRVYSDTPRREERPAFSVESYDMDLNLHRRLSASVNMQLTPAGAGQDYTFTLYHRFRIRGLTDTQGKPVPYTRDGDQFTVAAKDMPADCRLTVRYDGWSHKYYSNAQGTALPGYFPWYPMAGVRTVYADGQYNTEPDWGNHDFTLRINAPYKLHSNLSGEGAVLQGEAACVSLFGGMMETVTRSGQNVHLFSAYRNRDFESVLEKQQALYESLCARLARPVDTDLRQGDVIMLPVFFHMNSHGEYVEWMGDHWLIHQDVILSETLAEEMFFSPWPNRGTKGALAYAMGTYLLYEPEIDENMTAQTVLEELSRLQTVSGEDGLFSSEEPAVLRALQLIDEAQTENVLYLQKIDQYLRGENDVDALSFLSDMMKEAMGQ